MSHRMLIAYELDDGRYYVVYSRWGAIRLAEDDFGPTRPFAGGYLQPIQQLRDRALTDYYTAVASERDPDEPQFKDEDFEDDPESYYSSLRTIASERLDFLDHEGFIVVDDEWNARRYRTIWTNVLPTDTDELYTEYETIGEGILYRSPEPRTDDIDVRASHEKRNEFADRIVAGELSMPEAQSLFREWVRTWDELDPDCVPAFSPYQLCE